MDKKERQEKILDRIATTEVGQLLSTRELSEAFDVSEITMRRDLQELAKAGLIHREHGGVSLPKAPTQELRSVGVLLVINYGKFSNVFFNELLEGADKEFLRLGYRTAFVKTFLEVEAEADIQQLLQQQAIDGLLIIGGLGTALFQKWQSHIPHIVNTLAITDKQTDTILFDAVGGMYQMIQHLAQLGHQRIGFIHGEHITGIADDRLQGYLNGIADFQLDDDPDLLIQISATLERRPDKIGQDGAKELMYLSEPPTAIMCLSDLIAIGASQWLQEAGYSVPEDIVITGFDNIPDASRTFPALTTVNVHKSFIGRLAAQQLHQRIENPDDPPIVITTPTELVVRQSCGTNI